MNQMMNQMMSQMMNMAYQQPQQQMYGVAPEKQSNPFWYRENTGYLVGVTNAPSNPMFGIENIVLNPRTGNQPNTLLANGRLATMIGHISFQVFMSSKGAPYVFTNSSKNEKNNTYFEHVLLKPQVKAQILRYYEAWASAGGMQQMAQQPMQQMNVGFGMPQMQMPQQAVQQPQQVQQPDMMQMMMVMQQMQAMQQQMAQQMNTAEQTEVANENNQAESANNVADNQAVPATEDDMPI